MEYFSKEIKDKALIMKQSDIFDEFVKTEKEIRIYAKLGLIKKLIESYNRHLFYEKLLIYTYTPEYEKQRIERGY